jgi:cell surface protein SprA
MKVSNIRFFLFLAFLAVSLTVYAAWVPEVFEDALETVISRDTFPDTDPFNGGVYNPFDLKDPANVIKDIEYDPVTGQYIITEKIGDDYFSAPSYMTIQEYLKWKSEQQERDYFNRISGIGSSGKGSGNDPISGLVVKKSLVDRLFGGDEIDIRPQGSVDLNFGVNYRFTDNPNFPKRSQRYFVPKFDMIIRMNLEGGIGEKLKINFNYDSKATYNFDQQIKIHYDGVSFNEDDIIQNIEAGDVSLPLKSSLIQGSQSLLGIRTDLKFGHLRLSAIASQSKSKQQNLLIQGGAVEQEFEVRADEYDENRHFFLSHYNRAIFEPSLKNLPQISNLFRIKNIQVWITDVRQETSDIRDIIAIADLAEHDSIAAVSKNFFSIPGSVNPDLRGNYELPANNANLFFEEIKATDGTDGVSTAKTILESAPFSLVPGRDFEKKRAKLLSPSEYIINEELGFISIRQALDPDDVLAVAYEYDYNGKTYKVGEFSTDNPQTGEEDKVLYLKMLKSSTSPTDMHTWDLMMKNMYAIGAYNVNEEEFDLDIYYEDPGEGEKRFLPEVELNQKPLLRIFNLDNLSVYKDPIPDGNFDFVDGITIFPSTGRIMFPVLEPFGQSLKDSLAETYHNKYVYEELYDFPLTRAREYPEFNRFTIRGKYKSSVTSEISLGTFNLPPGSLRVTAGGKQLVENVDYEVNYNLGTVKILNDSYLASGVPVKVNFEDNTLFSIQTKSMVGLRADYDFNKDFNIGATYLHLFEKPYTRKVNFGDDPINNRIFGVDANYSKDAPWLTRLVDKLPAISTVAPSRLTLSAEAAALKPGHAKAINQNDEKSGVVYIDDFEGAASQIDLRTPTNQWVLASVPQHNPGVGNSFPEASFSDSLITGYNRALLNWYRLESDGRTEAERNDPYVEAVTEKDLFENKTPHFGTISDLRPLDLSFYPDERGPYNFDPPKGVEGISEGLNSDGTLKSPETRWGGIMRSLYTTDFDRANIEYIEFWLLNPFIQTNQRTPTDGGFININLGNVSEDIMKDGLTFYENGLPTDPELYNNVNTSKWGRVPRTIPLTHGFDNDPDKKLVQDIGLDGLDDDGELEHFSDYYDLIFPFLTPQALNNFEEDISNDNYAHFRDESAYDTNNDPAFVKYRKFNNPQGNTPTAQGSQFSNSYTQYPDAEDLNQDNTSDETESYFEYKIPINPDGTGESMEMNDYITDQITVPDPNDQYNNKTWYRFKVPVQQFTSKVGGIQDFRAIKFMRIYLTDFEKPVTLRFATLDLVRNQWRKYSRNNIDETNLHEPVDPDDPVTFELNSVSYEEHSSRQPFNYVIPPGIELESFYSSLNAQQFQDEKSIALNVCNLPDGAARAIYKGVYFDFRNFKELKMFAHCEPSNGTQLDDGDLRLEIRMGSDFTENYYQYSLPLKISEGAENDQLAIWPEENNMGFSLDLLKQIKVDRNTADLPLNEIYSINDPDNPDNLVGVRGNPNLGYVKNIMILVRNVNDSKGPICSEVWLNELRLAGLNEKGGLAALARMDMQLADFGNIAVAGSYSSIGWGGLEQKLAERSQEEVYQYDISGSFELGQFLPEKSGIKLPLYMYYTQTTRQPQYDPYDLDIDFKEKVASYSDNKEARDSVRDQAIDFVSDKGISLNNVRKERSKKEKKPKPWDIANWSLSYAFNEISRHNPVLQTDDATLHKGNISYSYSHKAKPITPFKKAIKNDKYLKLISEFNFNPLPNSFTFSSDFNKLKNEKVFRFENLEWFDRRFTWDRNYNLRWNLTKALSFDYAANVNTFVDELDQFGNDIYKQKYDGNRRDYVFENLGSFGRKKNFNHNINVKYTLPFKHIPLLDFVNVRLSGRADYGWNAASINTDSLGHIIQNQQTRQVTADLDFQKLYGKSKYLSKIEGKKSSGRIPRMGAQQSRASAKSKDEPTKKETEKKKKDRDPSKIEKVIIRPLLLVRTARINYSERYGSVVPGFTEVPEYIGLSNGFTSPGLAYITGFTPDRDWFTNAVADGQDWFTESIYLNNETRVDTVVTFEGKVTIEPFNDFKLEVNISKDYNRTSTGLFKNIDVNSEAYDDRNNYLFEYLNPRQFGSYKVSYMALNTLFGYGGIFKGTEQSEADIKSLFDDFSNTREIISNRRNPDGDVHALDDDSTTVAIEYREGYGKYQQEVLIPAFISAYTKQDANTMDMDVFNTRPRPNWKLRYDGLSKIEFLEEIFSNISFTHGYVSFLSLNSYQTNSEYNIQGPDAFNPNTLDFYSRFEFNNIVIDEKFNPLIGVEVTTKNDLNLSFNYKKSRNLALNFQDSRMNERKSSEISFGFGLLFKDVYLSFLPGVSKKPSKSKKGKAAGTPTNTKGKRSPRGSGNVRDLRMRLDVSYRDDLQYTHLLDRTDSSVATRGQRGFKISPSMDYEINEFIGLRFYVDYSKTIPYTSLQYPSTTVNGGMTIKVKFNG